MPREAKTADEIDVVYARRFLRWRRGDVNRIKRRMRRRERHEARQKLRSEED